MLGYARERGWPRPALYTDIGLPGWRRPGSALARLAHRITAGRHDAVITVDRALLGEIPGMDEAGCAVFLRDAQVFWPEAGPFLDSRARRAARRLGLPPDPGELLQDVARGRGEEVLGWLAGALALVDARDEYGQIQSHVPA